jgi:hypothetical protein
MGDVATYSRPRVPRPHAIAVAVCVVIAALGVVVVILSNRGSTASGALRGARLTMRIVDASSAQADVDTLAGPGRLSVLQVDGRARQEAVVGQLTYDQHASRSGQYALFVIDNDSHQVAPLMWGAGPPGSSVGQGWDGRYNSLAHNHAWLAPLAETRGPGGDWSDPGTAVSFPADTRGPITFAAYLPADALPINDPAQQLTIALAYLDADGNPSWVRQLTA